MTSISALSSGSQQSPLQKLQAELQAEVQSGAISSSDQSALSSALSDIDSSLRSSVTGGTKASPGDLKSKVDDLISNEVSSGKLTSDQATELQGLFKSAFAHGSGGAHGGHPSGPPPADDSSSTDGSSSSGNSIADILKQFIASLQNAQSTSLSYDASGSASSSSTQSSSISALLVDYKS